MKSNHQYMRFSFTAPPTPMDAENVVKALRSVLPASYVFSGARPSLGAAGREGLGVSGKSCTLELEEPRCAQGRARSGLATSVHGPSARLILEVQATQEVGLDRMKGEGHGTNQTAENAG